ncbi:MAG TPA: S4 domain-containing protein, partial [Anaerolineaceae bacterium]|nr:S4 domain-containing protein [Anaerolineaceae bacterium]
MSSQRCQFIVQSGDENRLDKFLARQLPGQSRSRLQAIIKDGGVTVNETVATKSGLALLTGDKVSICIPEVVPVNLEPESIPLDIVFENEHLVIINKPAGMVVHPAPG